MRLFYIQGWVNECDLSYATLMWKGNIAYIDKHLSFDCCQILYKLHYSVCVCYQVIADNHVNGGENGRKTILCAHQALFFAKKPLKPRFSLINTVRALHHPF